MLVGTRCGRICGWDPAGAAPAPRLGLPARLNAVTSLDLLDADRIVFGCRSGAAVVQSRADALACEEFRLGAPADCSAFSPADATFFFGAGAAVFAQRLSPIEAAVDFAELARLPCEALIRLRWCEGQLAAFPRGGQFTLLDTLTGARTFHAKASRGDELNVSPRPHFVDGARLDSGCFAAATLHEVRSSAVPVRPARAAPQSLE